MNHIFITSNSELRVGWKTSLSIFGTIVFGILLNMILVTVLTGSDVSQGHAQEQAMEKATHDKFQEKR